MANDFREGPWNDRKFPGPVRHFMGPAKPGGFVGFPFGGHVKAERVGSAGGGCHRQWALRNGFSFNTEPAESTERTRSSESFFAEPAIEDGLVGINAPIAQEGPVAASVFALGGIAFDDENLLFAV